MLDNERCILCSRCVRFTREISKSDALGIQHRGDHSLVRAVEDGAFERRPVFRQRHRPLPGRRAAVAAVPAQGARLVPRADALGLPGLRARLQRRHLAPQEGVEAEPRSTRRANARIDRVTPRENPAVNGPWICNKGRDLAAIFERPRAHGGDAQRRGRSSSKPRSTQARRADRRGAPPGGAGLELGLERGARRLPCRARRALRLLRQDRPPAAAGRAPRGRAADQARQEPEPRAAPPRSIRRCPTRRAPRSPRDATWSWCGARAATSTPCRRGAKVVHLDAWRQPANGPRRRLPADQRADRAQRPLHELRGRREPLRACFDKPADGGRRRGAVRRARGCRREVGGVMTQDLVVALVFIVYAMGMLITFGTVLTWVERKQAAVMSDRIGANRAYIRIPFTQVKLVWWGLFHGIADGLKMMLKENFQPRTYDRFAYALAPVGRRSRRCCWSSPSFPSAARSTPGALVPGARRLVRRPHLPDADRPARRRPAGRVRVQRPDHHRHDARRLVLDNKFSLLGGAARRLADDLLRARHGPHRARADPDLRHARPRRDRAPAVGHRCSAACRPGASSTSPSPPCSS